MYGAPRRSRPRDQQLRLANQVPSEPLRLELSWDDEPKSPYLSPGFAAAWVEGYTSGRLTAARTIELLRGTMTRDDLPDRERESLDDVRKLFALSGD
jgi:hypothetical protein